MKLTLRQRHGVTHDAITPFAVEYDAAATIDIPGLVGERLCDGTIGDAIGNEGVMLLCRARRCRRRQGSNRCCDVKHIRPPPTSALRPPE